LRLTGRRWDQADLAVGPVRWTGPKPAGPDRPAGPVPVADPIPAPPPL